MYWLIVSVVSAIAHTVASRDAAPLAWVSSSRDSFHIRAKLDPYTAISNATIHFCVQYNKLAGTSKISFPFFRSALDKLKSVTLNCYEAALFFLRYLLCTCWSCLLLNSVSPWVRAASPGTTSCVAVPVHVTILSRGALAAGADRWVICRGIWFRGWFGSSSTFTSWIMWPEFLRFHISTLREKIWSPSLRRFVLN